MISIGAPKGVIHLVINSMKYLNPTQKSLIAILILIAVFACEQNKKQVTNLKSTVVERNGNVHIIYPDSTSRQLTFTNKDYHPYLLERYNSVLFTRYDKDSEKKLVIVKDLTLEETVILDSIGSMRELAISKDENWLMLINNNILNSVYLPNGNTSNYGPASSFVLIDSDPYRNHFIKINIIEEQQERILELNLLDSSGSIKKEFQSPDNLKSFVKQNISGSFGELMSKLDLVYQRLVMMDSLDQRNIRIKLLTEDLETIERELLEANKRLRSINEFRLGRSLTEKEKQISTQLKLIEMIENKLQSMQDKHNIELKEYFDLERKLAGL